MIIFRFLRWVIKKYFYQTFGISISCLMIFPLERFFWVMLDILSGTSVDTINWMTIPLRGIYAATISFFGGMIVAIFIEFIALIWHKIKMKFVYKNRFK